MKCSILVLFLVSICLLGSTIETESIYFNDDFKMISDENMGEFITNTTINKKKSVLRAELYSLGVTVLPLVPTYVSYLIERDPYTDVSNSLQTVSYVLATAGLLIGPRAGHLYLGDRSLTTTCVRTTAALSGSASFLLTLGGAYHHNDTYATIGMTGLWISGIVFLGATIYDFATIPLKVNNYNKNFKKKQQYSFNTRL